MMDYGAWTLARLWDECRKRNARTTEKIAISWKDLMLMIEIKNLGKKNDEIAESYEMQIPDPTQYNDIHS